MAGDRRLFFLMFHAQRALASHANARLMESLGITSVQLGMLYYVAKHPGCSLTDVATVFDLNKSAVGATTLRLESAGVLRREADPDDARANKLYVTTKGEDIRQRSLPSVRKLTADVTEGFSEPEIDAIYRFLNGIVDRYGDPVEE